MNIQISVLYLHELYIYINILYKYKDILSPIYKIGKELIQTPLVF